MSVSRSLFACGRPIPKDLEEVKEVMIGPWRRHEGFGGLTLVVGDVFEHGQAVRLESCIDGPDARHGAGP